MKKLSNFIFVLAIGISGYTLISTTLERQRLPEGVCPIDARTEWYYLSIVLLLVSFAMSFLEKKKS
ncbi:hypothetical protein [Fusibacter tunisiensis]|jgi:hypothetical protein|uniref:Uncharacterized protein n=1 Tax=Fusibacter tunisiensis TaxID=1008308 RepID=A0ABS2MT48_9FIRM|nr:hypothetical protein [Fusibacter tunisiensis]MBM7562582.1 hypothetical protein [Fusibacter tunisiensis]